MTEFYFRNLLIIFKKLRFPKEDRMLEMIQSNLYSHVFMQIYIHTLQMDGGREKIVPCTSATHKCISSVILKWTEKHSACERFYFLCNFCAVRLTER